MNIVLYCTPHHDSRGVVYLVFSPHCHARDMLSWQVHGLCLAAGISKDGAVRHVMTEGTTSTSAPGPLHDASPSTSAHDVALRQMQLLIDSGHDQDIAQAILDDEKSVLIITAALPLLCSDLLPSLCQFASAYHPLASHLTIFPPVRTLIPLHSQSKKWKRC